MKDRLLGMNFTPPDGDYIILQRDGRYHVVRQGKARIATVSTLDDADAAIRLDSVDRGWYSAVWSMTDEGWVQHYTMSSTLS